MAEEEGFPQVGDMISFGNTIKITLKVLQVDDNVIERVECKMQ
jgi:hypothetical protein